MVLIIHHYHCFYTDEKDHREGGLTQQIQFKHILLVEHRSPRPNSLHCQGSCVLCSDIAVCVSSVMVLSEKGSPLGPETLQILYSGKQPVPFSIHSPWLAGVKVEVICFAVIFTNSSESCPITFLQITLLRSKGPDRRTGCCLSWWASDASLVRLLSGMLQSTFWQFVHASLREQSPFPHTAQGGLISGLSCVPHPKFLC